MAPPPTVRPPGGRWRACWATGSSAATACGRSSNEQPGRLIGRAGLYNPEGWPGLEAGWLLARDRWGQGLATEAGHAILADAFTKLSSDRLISLIHPGNTASIRVAERLGERLERQLDLNGQRALVYGISHQRWQQRQEVQTDPNLRTHQRLVSAKGET